MGQTAPLLWAARRSAARSALESVDRGESRQDPAAGRGWQDQQGDAGDVFLSDKTVKDDVSSILSKLNLQRRTQAAAFVAKRHLAPPDDG
jgi:two-component system, NarL family, response regulator DevR